MSDSTSRHCDPETDYSPAMAVNVAMVQMECSSDEPVHSRVTRGFALIRKAAAAAELVMLPELWHVGAFDIEAARSHAQPIDGPLVTDMAALAGELGIWLHGGSFSEVDEDGSHFNTSVLFAPDGRLVASYRKIHLFGFEGGETVLMSGGNELVVVDTPLGPTGLATCYDLRFPEMFRALTQGGAAAFLICSGWPSARISHWDVLTQARAIENQAWLLACNQVGVQPGVTLGGHSCAISPTGDVVEHSGDREAIVKVSLDPTVATTWREQFPVLGDIRLA